MPFQAVPDAITCQIRFERAGAFWGTNTFDFVDDLGEPSTARVHELTDVVWDWFNDNMRDVLSTEVSLVRVEARSLSVEFGPYWTNTDTIAGTHASPALPPNATIAVTRFTGNTGRSRRGRIYMCGMSEDHVTGKFVLPGYTDVLTPLLEALQLAAAAADFRHVIVSRVQEGVTLPAGVTYTVEGYRFYDNRVDSMKTRLVE